MGEGGAGRHGGGRIAGGRKDGARICFAGRRNGTEDRGWGTIYCELGRGGGKTHRMKKKRTRDGLGSGMQYLISYSY